MKTFIPVLLLFLSVSLGWANPFVDIDFFGKQIGGWEHEDKRAAEYEIHGSKYRTWMPEITRTVSGGIFVSIRIDHKRGLFSSDDHASLELEFDKERNLIGATSSIMFQGESTKGEAIKATARAGSSIIGLEAAAKIGTDLISDITSKITKNKKNEPGRVTMPAVIRHNYNLLCIATGVVKEEAKLGVKPPTKSLKIITEE